MNVTFAETPEEALKSSRPYSQTVESDDGMSSGASLAPFAVVPIANLSHDRPALSADWWEGYIPADVVTLLGAHGGLGKSMIGLMFGVSMSLELPLFGIPTRRGKVAYFSGEDPANLIRYRLRWICDKMGVDPASLDGRLHILDATDGDPVLFRELGTGTRRTGATTPTYEALRAYIDREGINLLIVDNASDAFDASEIERSKVRAFMRALAKIAPSVSVLLLAHVDKGTSRGDRTGTEGYSGSTAWHNSARSRLFLSRDGNGLKLEHQKNNLGRLREPLQLLWPEGGIPEVDAPPSGFVQHIAERGHTQALLKLIAEFSQRGEYVSPVQNSPANAARMFGKEPTYPRGLKASDTARLLRDAERAGFVEREQYRNANRKPHERWTLTQKGREHGGIAPSAPCAPSA